MSFKKLILFLIVPLVLSSCASRGTYHAVLDSWIGSTENELVKSWGQPLKSYSQENSKYLVYDKSGPGSGGYHEAIIDTGCTTTFEVVDKTIISFDFEGVNCRSW